MLPCLDLRRKNSNSMKKVFSIIAALLLWGMTALAQKQLPANWYFTTLDNGLQLLVIEDNSVPLVTIEIAVHNGAFTEDSNYNGLSHLYEHMFFKANKDIPSQEAYLARLSELGITLGPSANGTTGDERVNYFITLNSSKLEDGLRFMNSAIRYPLFLPEEMKKKIRWLMVSFNAQNQIPPSRFFRISTSACGATLLRGRMASAFMM